MKTNKLIKEMKKFNRQVPSEELENKVRHNIKTNFVFDEKPAYKFKRFVMKTWMKLAFSSVVTVIITACIVFYLFDQPNQVVTSTQKFNRSLDSAATHKKPGKIAGLKRATKVSSKKDDYLGRISDKKESLAFLFESETANGPMSQISEDNESLIVLSESKAVNGPARKWSMAKAKGKKRASSVRYDYDCFGASPVTMQVLKPQPRENFNTEDYDRIYDNEFKEALNTPLSTFSIDVDSASYANLRRFLNANAMPPKGAVRIEEMINYFTYDYPQPKNDLPFTITTEVVKCPWKPENNLVMIGLQGKEIKIDKLPPNNLVFLLDVSGSMNSRNKLPLLKSAFKLLVKQLRPIDRVSIVVYAGAAGLVLDATPGDRKDKILKAIDNLKAGGSTAGGAGIKLAYKIAKDNLISNGNNRIIIATDGDFNIGVSSDSALVRMIEERRDQGIFLTVLGFGMGNYKDNKMEKLADKGNGNYAYIDDIMEAKKVLVNELGATLFTIAKDVKLQIEFNPSEVKAYRLIGYENRVLAKEDFNDDKKDAGELGAGHSVTAFYEIVPADSTQTFAKVDDLKYQKTKINKSKELLTIKLRYKKPDEDKSKLISKIVKSDDIKKEMSENCAFACAVAEFGMLLRDSEYKGSASYKSILDRARNSKGKDFNGYRAEFVRLVERAELVKQ